jgi:hypothetical protein
MLVLTLGSVFLILIIPLAALAALASTTVAGWALAAGLLACAAGWLWLMAGWAEPDQVANGALVLTILTPVLIMAGRLPDRVAVVRFAGSARVRLITGHSLAAICVCLNVLVLVALVIGAIYLGWAYTYTPPSSDVLPLPAALTVVSDRDQGCSGGTSETCGREIVVTSAAGLSAERTVQVVTSALTRLHGWRLGPEQSGCRHEGWLLGREDICVEVQAGQHAVQVLVDGSLP